MAEKPRTTPRTADSARRRKRAAPTIDLTATEVPPVAAAATPREPQRRTPPEPPVSDPRPQPEPVEEPPSDPDPAPPPPPEKDPPPVEEPPRSPDEPTRVVAASGGSPWSTIAAGFAGGAIVLLALLALWLAGVLPQGNVAPGDNGAQLAALQAQLRDLQNRPAPTGDTRTLDALGQRVGRIEDAVTKLPAGDTGVSERVAAADNALRSLGVALAALNKRNDDIAASATAARERADAADKAVTDLRASFQDAAKNASPSIAPAELSALQQRVSALEQSTKAAREEIARISSADAPVRLAVSASLLRDAAAGGQPFATELAQAKSLGADDAALAPLAPFAAAGVPSTQTLAQELRALIPALAKVSGAQAPEGGFLDRLQANAGKLVRVRPVDAPPGDDASAVLVRVEIAAARADIPAALAELGRLDAATRAPAQAWIAKANARQAALAAARKLAADSARALGPK